MINLKCNVSYSISIIINATYHNLNLNFVTYSTSIFYCKSIILGVYRIITIIKTLAERKQPINLNLNG